MEPGFFFVMIGLSIGLQLGWHSDWYRRLFKMGPYKKPPKPPTTDYHWKD